MTGTNATLCSPDWEKSCFACCPPIRPAGYEHIQYKNILIRELRENTRRMSKTDLNTVPITGFSCWALGYLDERFRRIGCLLHPYQNQGSDLRFRIEYGEKCRRESCPESAIFAELTGDTKRFWLQLADGLDSFAYSSRKENPLFSLMAWGPFLLELIPKVESARHVGKMIFFEEYPFFSAVETPRAHAYPATCIIRESSAHLLKMPAFTEEFLRFSRSLSCTLRLEAMKTCSTVSIGCIEPLRNGAGASKLSVTRSEVACDGHSEMPTGPFHGEDSDMGHAVHRLPVDREFLDFLRLSVKITKIGLEDVLVLKTRTDEELERFRRIVA